MRADADPDRLELVPAHQGGSLPVASSLPSPQAEAVWVSQHLLRLIGGLDSRQVEAGPEGEGYSARDVAILYRLHAQAPALTEALTKAGIPFQTAAKTPLAETDPLDFRAQRVSLLSLHAAKGLEFPVVFIVGLEEKLLPYEPPEKDPADLGEERRLLYVGMTRAREWLFLSRAGKRSLYGNTYEPGPSPFWRDLPRDAVSNQKVSMPARKAKQLGLFG
jgi:DNA helicase-2/ATP-dependent DNA helicase PcrA